MSPTKIKISIVVLAGVLLLLGVVSLVWVLADSTPQVPLAVRVLYRTNDPSGQMRYVIAVTNLTRDWFVVQLSRSFTNRIWEPTQSGPFVLFDGFQLRSYSTRVIAVAPRNGAIQAPALWYQRVNAWPGWYRKAHRWVHSLLRMRPPTPSPPVQFFIDLSRE